MRLRYYSVKLLFGLGMFLICVFGFGTVALAQVDVLDENNMALNKVCYWLDDKNKTAHIAGNREIGTSCSPLATGAIVIPDQVVKAGITYDVKSILYRAFYRVPITSVTIPSSVTFIDAEAFSCCTSLTSVDIADGLLSIGDEVFYNCTSLTNVVFPVSVKSVGRDMFSLCENLTAYRILSGDTVELLMLPDSIRNSDTPVINWNVDIGGKTYSIASIGRSAFHSCYFYNLSIPSTVKYVAPDAFQGCYANIYHIVSDSTVEVVRARGTEAISNPNVYIDGKYYKLIGIGNGAFFKNSSPSSVTIPDYITYIGDGAFSGYDNLTSITISDSVKSIGDDVFSGCTSLMSITIPDSVESIGRDVFSGCTNLVSIKMPDNVTSIVVAGCTSLTSVNIPNSVTSIDDSAFLGCASLTSITIPDGVTTIGNAAFKDCTKLTSITIPGSVTSIGNSAFAGCEMLTSIILPSDITSINDNTFDGCKALTSVNIPDSVISIGDKAFYRCTKLASVTGLSDVTSIGAYAFQGCEVLTSVELPNIEVIGAQAFYGCYKLSSVDVGDNLTFLDRGAFGHCPFTSINLPDGLTYIGSYAFVYCGSLKTITIPNSVINIGKEWHGNDGGIFGSCTSLESVILSNNLTSLTDSMFKRCSSLTSITIPDSVTSIDARAFASCNSLTSVTMPDSVTSIGSDAFAAYIGDIYRDDYVINSSIEDIYFIGSEEQWANIPHADAKIDESKVRFIPKGMVTGKPPVSGDGNVKGTIQPVIIKAIVPTSVPFRIDPVKKTVNYNINETDTNMTFSSPSFDIINDCYAPITVSVVSMTVTGDAPQIVTQDIAPLSDDDDTSDHAEWMSLGKSETANKIALGFAVPADNSGNWNAGYAQKVWYNGAKLDIGTLNGKASGRLALKAKYGLAWDSAKTFNYEITYGISAA